MLVKPDVQDEEILACLHVEYGLQIVQVTFLPLGGDLSTAVYRAVADDETAFFCKLKRGAFDEATVELPKFLSDQGIAQIIAPLATQSGRLRAELGDFTLMLSPFVEGRDGYEVELSARQWADFGAALVRIHTMVMPPALTRGIRRESYSPEWRAGCRNVVARLDEDTFDDPLAVDASKFLRSHRGTILDCVERAKQLAHAAASRPLEFVLCHSDAHPGNLLVDTEGKLYLVDWDYPMLAPKERDLMFIGGGQGFSGVSAQQEEDLFYRGYGPSRIDPVAMAYYRYERLITDITVESERIFSKTLDDQDRAQSFEILQLFFLPDCTVEMAYASDGTRADS